MFIIPLLFKNVLWESQYKFFLNPLDSSTTNIVKDIFIIAIEDIYHLVVKKC